MPINFKITELNESPKAYNTDLLMISKNISDNIYSSYKISLSALLSIFDDKFEKTDPVKISKIWKVNSGGIFVHDSNIVGKTSVINLKYAYETFMDKFTKLKNLIYETPCIPSTVGELIFSTSLNTIEKVQKKYGAHTNWEQIQGRFVMGGSNTSALKGEIGKLAGAAKVSLTLNNIPPHTHRLDMNENTKTISLNEMKELAIKNVCVAGIQAEPKVSSSGETFCIYPGDRDIVNDIVVETSVGSRESTREIELSTKGTITANTGGNLGHNNIPPFYSVYIWRRKS